MATIGSLQVNIVANSNKFISGMNQARGSLGKFVSGVSTLQGVVGGVIAGTFVKLANDAIESGSRIYEMARKLHVTTEEITALHYAAEQLESSTDAVDMGMTKMGIALGKALLGSHEAAQAFGQLGLNVKDLSKLSPANQFLRVIDALHNVKDESIRAAIAQKVFGRGSAELANLISAGAEKIVEAAGEAARAGGLIGSGVAKNLNESGDALKRMTAGWRAFRDELVSTISPFILFVEWCGTKAVQTVKFFFGVFRSGFALALEVATASILGIITLLNKILPKSMQIDTSGIEKFTKAAAQQFNQEIANTGKTAKAYLGLGNAQENPLKAPPQKTDDPVAKNTAALNDTMSQLLAFWKENYQKQQPQQQPVVLQTAGMR